MRGIILLKIKQKLAIFFEFVELRTKVASVFPMLAGFLWTYYRLGRFNWVNASIFALAVTWITRPAKMSLGSIN